MKKPRLCLFCNNIADSKEDVVPVWIQQRVKGKGSFVVNGFSGDRTIIMQGLKPNVKIKCVCEVCNHGWMSRLEASAKTVLSALMADIQMGLDRDQQLLIAKWALKTSITAESFNFTSRKLFYTRKECSSFRDSWMFPAHMLICLGRYQGGFDMGVFGVDGWDNKPDHIDVTQSYVTTLVFNRLVIQVVVVHVRKDSNYARIDLQMIAGPWQQSLVILNPFGPALFWPPSLSFEDKGILSLQNLVYRFSIGGIPINPLKPDM